MADDIMLQAHYLKIYTREYGWVPLTDTRFGARDYLPRRFEDWWAANQEATKGDAGKDNLVKIFPYYPEHADGERAHIDRLIAAEEENFERLTAEHKAKLAELLAKKAAVPS